MSTINVQFQTLSDARNIGRVSDLLSESFNRLSSGTRITHPSQDPAGVGSIGQLDAQNKRAQAAALNVQNASSYVQSASGFMSSMADIVSRMSQLGQYSSDGLKSPSDLALYQTEFKQLQDQLRQTVGGSTAEIGGLYDIDKPLGRFDGNVLFGANPGGLSIASGSHAGESITLPETNLRAGALRDLIVQDAGGNYTMQATDAGVVTKVSAAMDELADKRSILGGAGSRLEFAAQSLAVEHENLTAAVSRIQDIDVAAESTRLTKFNILLQGSSAMLSQANQSPQAVLKLLQT